jgi:nucleotide-binding universal stress UspA family protein
MPLRILLAADGSAYTKLAARHIARHLDWFAGTPEIHVLHVEAPLPYPRAQAVVGKAAVLAFQREEAEAALAVAEKELDDANVAYRSAWSVGDVATEIGRHVKAHGIDLVVIGSHGHGALASFALGSVAQKCIATLEVPVLVVRVELQKPTARTAKKAARVPAKATP